MHTYAHASWDSHLVSPHIARLRNDLYVKVFSSLHVKVPFFCLPPWAAPYIVSAASGVYLDAAAFWYELGPSWYAQTPSPCSANEPSSCWLSRISFITSCWDMPNALLPYGLTRCR